MIALDASALLAFLLRERGHWRPGPRIDSSKLAVTRRIDAYAQIMHTTAYEDNTRN